MGDVQHVAIVGGGATGAALAYNLSLRDVQVIVKTLYSYTFFDEKIFVLSKLFRFVGVLTKMY